MCRYNAGYRREMASPRLATVVLTSLALMLGTSVPAEAITLVGNGGPDTLKGKRGNDVLRGKGGNDVLRGGPSRDHLFGGPGVDKADGWYGRDQCVAETRTRCER